MFYTFTLNRLKKERNIKALIEEFKNYPSDWSNKRKSITRAMAEVCQHQDIYGPMREVFENKGNEVWWETQKSLGKTSYYLDQLAMVEFVLQLAFYKDGLSPLIQVVRKEAAKILCKIGPSAVDFLKDLYKDGNDNTRYSIIGMFENMGDIDALKSIALETTNIFQLASIGEGVKKLEAK